MKEILDNLERWRARGERVAIATVIATRRSAPRPVGSTFATSETGDLAGSISGGCVEADVCLNAREIIESGKPRLLSYGIADDDAWSIGIPCGGEIDVFVQALGDAAVTTRLVQAIAREERAALFTIVEGEPLGARLLVLEGGERVGDGVLEPLAARARELIRRHRSQVIEEEGLRVFAEIHEPPPRLFVYGAIDTAEAVCAAARLLGWRTIVADGRPAFVTRDRIPSADELIVAWPEEAFARVRPDQATAVLVLTHDAKFDLPSLKAALRTEAFYIGALGSRHNHERRRERLLDAGVGDDAIDRIAGPCGLDIGAESQPETALSILAEIIATRAGRGGGKLGHSTHRIHGGSASAVGTPPHP